MFSTQVFIYTQRQIVVLLSGYSPRSYMPQYAKPLTLHKGVDNQIQFAREVVDDGQLLALQKQNVGAAQFVGRAGGL